MLKICGLPVKAATHREAVALILGRTRLELKVRSGGVIPVKLSRAADPRSTRQTIRHQKIFKRTTRAAIG